ncbi:MAG: hypothetical protein J0I42_20710 [Bosea sp.]|uniref:hypothetical protein n=1 Tax=Bosea sp. (in: a-proteobacteria) TaxID=1871050 RepID=UPI001ACFE53B|nr:hypothetical protein [Bosea sp. (in: a-proteobacteria)]MBN9454365.1 hypothetical protein [Bosea sp. (in: a-proteobacteria)]
MTNVLAFHRPTPVIGFGTRPARSGEVLSFARRPAIRAPRLVAEWRFNDRVQRLECHWRSEDDETGWQEASRRSRTGLSAAAGGAGLRHARRKAARRVGDVGRSPAEVS